MGARSSPGEADEEVCVRPERCAIASAAQSLHSESLSSLARADPGAESSLYDSSSPSPSCSSSSSSAARYASSSSDAAVSSKRSNAAVDTISSSPSAGGPASSFSLYSYIYKAVM